MRDDDQPAPGAVPLSEALNPQLVEVVRRAGERLTAARAAVPPQPSWFDGARLEAVEAWEHSPAVRAEAAAQGEANHAWRAAADDRRTRLINGEWLAWGHEDNPWGRWRAIPPDAWNTLVVINEEDGIVRGPKPAAARLYGVVVAPAQRQEMASSALASTIAAEDRCRKWLVNLMLDGKAPSGPKRGYASEARERFQAGSRAFARAWDAAIKETGNTGWRAPGRKRKP